MPSKPQHLDLMMVGDVMLGRLVDDSLTFDSERQETVWGDWREWREERKEPLVLAGNLECAITTQEVPFPKAFNFRLLPRNAQALSKMGFNFVSLANNHVLDYHEAGLRETQQVLDKQGIAHAGAGTEDEARRPAIVERAGVRIAFFSFSDHYDFWAAQGSKEGINYINPCQFDREQLQRMFTAAKPPPPPPEPPQQPGGAAPPGDAAAAAAGEAAGGGGGAAAAAASNSTSTSTSRGADLVVVFVHWGPNWRWEPDEDLVSLGHAFIDAGADLVFGHSPHHLQGVELYKGKPIIYSAGSFVDDYKVDAPFQNNIGSAWLARYSTATKELERLQALPVAIQQEWRKGKFLPAGQGMPPYLSSTARAKGVDFSWAASKLRELSKPFGTNLVVDEEKGVVNVRLPPKDQAPQQQLTVTVVPHSMS